MNLISILDILQGYIQIDSEVYIQGWVKTRRDSKLGISFLILYDGSCIDCLQIIANKSLINYKKDILSLTTGCSIRVTGYLKKSLKNKQKYEIQAKKIEILGKIKNPDTYPISSKYHTTEYLRKFLHLRPRTYLIGAITRIRHVLSKSIHQFMHEQGFFWISTPLITSIDTEGSGKMFNVSSLNLNNSICSKKIKFNNDFFGKEVFLTVSGQLAGESYACALSKIYTFGPTFRAEHSNTRRHLSEFWMIEPEMAFYTLEDAINLAEEMLKYVSQEILIHSYDDINFIYKGTKNTVYKHLNQLITKNFIHIDYTEVINILMYHENIFKNKISWGMDLSFEHECYLTEKYFQKPIIIKNYPKNIKAFYMRINDDLKTVSSMDIILPGVGEIIGGSQREERIQELDKRLEEFNLNKKEYKLYRDLRKYGTVPHSGFGLGLERLIMYITGIRNIRDVIPFPRTFNNIDF
ncbi:MAG: asparagine--tRNA ligase [Candidatus Westeberhardia cardiocondylae]|nr:asparagine--tRNA ligase [Candidatus Westeberhardia cardiocondylae]